MKPLHVRHNDSVTTDFLLEKTLTNVTHDDPDSKGSKIRDTKTLNLSRNIDSLHVFVDVSRFSPCVINLSRNKNICRGLKKVVAKSRARVYFEQQILALLLVFHQTHNLSYNKFARAPANQTISALHFFNPQQMFLLRVKLITPSEKRETLTKTCNETMLRNKLRVLYISYFAALTVYKSGLNGYYRIIYYSLTILSRNLTYKTEGFWHFSVILLGFQRTAL